MLKKSKSKKSTKGMVVTPAEHAKWHKENGGCGSGKEHAACMRKWGIRIAKKK
jgi:3-isopropylmalate dehydratase small subunit